MKLLKLLRYLIDNVDFKEMDIQLPYKQPLKLTCSIY
jgi:hypothetical protein